MKRQFILKQVLYMYINCSCWSNDSWWTHSSSAPCTPSSFSYSWQLPLKYFQGNNQIPGSPRLRNMSDFGKTCYAVLWNYSFPIVQHLWSSTRTPSTMCKHMHAYGCNLVYTHAFVNVYVQECVCACVPLFLGSFWIPPPT